MSKLSKPKHNKGQTMIHDDDLIVIPANMEVPALFKGQVHKMKFLASPSVVHTRRINMSTQTLQPGNPIRLIGSFIQNVLGFKTQDETEAELSRVPNVFLRHIRILNSKTGEYYHNKGGTVYVDLEADKGKFTFSYATCHHNDNFNKLIAKNECIDKMRRGEVIECINYDPALSILQNIYIAIGVLEGDYPLTEYDWKGILPELEGVFSEKQKESLRTLRRLIRNKARD